MAAAFHSERPHLRILGCRGIPAQHGGFETFAEDLALYLSKHGWDVSVYCQVEGAGEVHEDRWQGVRRVLVPGLLYGLALSAKASALAFGPQAMLVIALWNLAKEGALTAPAGSSVRGKLIHLWHATYQFRKDIVAIGFIGLVALFVYCGSDWSPDPMFVKWTDRLPEGDLKDAMLKESEKTRDCYTNARRDIDANLSAVLYVVGNFGLAGWDVIRVEKWNTTSAAGNTVISCINTRAKTEWKLPTKGI